MIFNTTVTANYDIDFDTSKFEAKYGRYPTKKEVIEELKILFNDFDKKFVNVPKVKFNTKYSEKKIKRGVGSY